VFTRAKGGVGDTDTYPCAKVKDILAAPAMGDPVIDALLATFQVHQRDHEEDNAYNGGLSATASQPETQSDDCSGFLNVFSGMLLQMGHTLAQQPPGPRGVASERVALARQFCQFLDIVLQQKVCPHSHLVLGGGTPGKVSVVLSRRVSLDAENFHVAPPTCGLVVCRCSRFCASWYRCWMWTARRMRLSRSLRTRCFS
jgi:hypothetical protein